MRQFKLYIPEMIAKHIIRLFTGYIYIYGIGHFKFEQGKLLLPIQPNTQDFQTVKEINQEVFKLKNAYV